MFARNPRHPSRLLEAAGLILGLVAVTASPSVSAAEPGSDLHHRNWPTWRGPLANGVVPHGNPPTEWSETKNIKWKVPIKGSGHATPVIWENKIFVLTAIPEPKASALVAPVQPRQVFAQAQGQEQGQRPDRPRRPGGGGGGRGGGFGAPPPSEPYAYTTLCLDRATGKVVWEKVSRKAVPHQGVQPSNSFSSGSPVTDGERLYVSFGSQGLYCYDLDGTLLWEKDLGKVEVMFGEGSSPALHGNTLIVVQDSMRGPSFIYAFDKKTGKELWKKERSEGSGWTTPYIWSHGGKTQVLVSGSKAVRSYDLETGEELWWCEGVGSNPVPMIVAHDTMIYAMSGHRQPTALAIKLGGSGDLTNSDRVVWKTNLGTPYVPSPLLYNGLLFFCQRTEARVSCLDPATGTAHYSQERVEGITGVYASPIGVQNRIYLAGQNGATAVLENSKQLKVLAMNTLDDGFDASPAVVGNELFLRGRANLYCIAAR